MWSQIDLNLDPDPPDLFTNCVTLDRWLNLSGTHLSNLRCGWELQDMVCIWCLVHYSADSRLPMFNIVILGLCDMFSFDPQKGRNHVLCIFILLVWEHVLKYILGEWIFDESMNEWSESNTLHFLSCEGQRIKVPASENPLQDMHLVEIIRRVNSGLECGGKKNKQRTREHCSFISYSSPLGGCESGQSPLTSDLWHIWPRHYRPFIAPLSWVWT
jgi:hypothetical protein